MIDPANRAQAQRVYEIAVQHLQTVQGCIDRLAEFGANEQLRLLSGRLQRLSFRATPEGGESADD
jgi:hypothetical protein